MRTPQRRTPPQRSSTPVIMDRHQERTTQRPAIRRPLPRQPTADTPRLGTHRARHRDIPRTARPYHRLPNQASHPRLNPDVQTGGTAGTTPTTNPQKPNSTNPSSSTLPTGQPRLRDLPGHRRAGVNGLKQPSASCGTPSQGLETGRYAPRLCPEMTRRAGRPHLFEAETGSVWLLSVGRRALIRLERAAWPTPGVEETRRGDDWARGIGPATRGKFPYHVLSRAAVAPRSLTLP